MIAFLLEDTRLDTPASERWPALGFGENRGLDLIRRSSLEL